MSVNLKEVAEYVAARHAISKKAAEEMVKDAFAYVKSEVAVGNEVNIDKFGKFVPEDKPARTGRNPKTGESLTIEAKTVVKFKPAKNFKDEVSNASQPTP